MLIDLLASIDKECKEVAGVEPWQRTQPGCSCSPGTIFSRFFVWNSQSWDEPVGLQIAEYEKAPEVASEPLRSSAGRKNRMLDFSCCPCCLVDLIWRRTKIPWKSTNTKQWGENSSWLTWCMATIIQLHRNLWIFVNRQNQQEPHKRNFPPCLVLDKIVFTTWGGIGGEVRYSWREVEGLVWGECSTSGHSWASMIRYWIGSRIRLDLGADLGSDHRLDLKS